MSFKESKAARADKAIINRARAAAAASAVQEPPPDTWSATMPAYCYTALCPDPELREAPKRKEKIERVRPVDVGKICLTCRKQYPIEADRCSCGGRLYVTGICRSTYPHKTGGDTDGQRGIEPVHRRLRAGEGDRGGYSAGKKTT